MKHCIVLSILCASLGLSPWLAGQPTPTVIPANPASTAPQPDAKAFEAISKVWTTPFKPQGKTGTCWSFSTTSFLESEAHRLGRGDFELSPMFTVYHAYEEKALRHVRTHGTNRFSEGGLSHDVLHVIRARGAVPRDCYTGLLDDAESHDHRELFRIVNGLVSGVIAAGGGAPLGARWSDGQFEARWINALRGTLDAYLGAPPATFEYGGRLLTPRQFADEALRLPLDDYVGITSYSQLPVFGSGELLLPDNWLHQPFYNVPLDDFMRIIDHALANGFSLVFDLHRNKEEGKSRCNYLLAFDEEADTHTTQDQRDTMLENWRAEDVHLVHGIGLAKDEAGRTFYLTKDTATPSSEENSDGYNKDYLSAEFVRSRVIFILLHKDGIPADIRARLGLGNK